MVKNFIDLNCETSEFRLWKQFSITFTQVSSFRFHLRTSTKQPTKSIWFQSTIFKGHLEFEEQNFGILIDDARKLGFNLVLQHCEKYLRQEADLSNFISILLCSSYGGHDDIVDKCLNFIRVSHFWSVWYEFARKWHMRALGWYPMSPSGLLFFVVFSPVIYQSGVNMSIFS